MVFSAEVVNERYNLITRNLQEIIGENELKQILESRDFKVYWGTATTGKPHLAYFMPICKIADFLKANCKVRILFADLHAYLDNQKAPLSLLKYRRQYYEELIQVMLRSMNVPLQNLTIVRGMDYQLEKNYITDCFQLAGNVSIHDAKKAGSEVVKQFEHPLLNGLNYPALQALDEEYLGVDGQFGGADQRKIFVMAEKYLPTIRYQKRIHLMNPMIPGTTGEKMSSSESKGKIDLLDTRESIEAKLNATEIDLEKLQDNGLMVFTKYVLFPIFDYRKDFRQGPFFRMARSPHTTYHRFEDLEDALLSRKIEIADFKATLLEFIDDLIIPLRNHFEQRQWSHLVGMAYPRNEHVYQPDAPIDDNGTDESSEIEKLLVDNLNAKLNTNGQDNNKAPEEPSVKMLNLIRRNLMCIRNEDELLDKMRFCRNRTFCLLWTVVPNERPAISMLAQLAKIVDFATAGFHVKIQLADLQAFMLYGSEVNGGLPWHLFKPRCDYFKEVLKALLETLGLDLYTVHVEFVRGFDFQLSRNYTIDVYRMGSVVTETEARHAIEQRLCGKISDRPVMNLLNFPILQALDEKHLKCDGQFGNEDCVAIFDLAEKSFKELKFEKRVHFVQKTIKELVEERIEFSDSANEIKKKLKKVFCEPGNVQNNPLLEFIEALIYPLFEHMQTFRGENGNIQSEFVVQRSPENGGTVVYKSFDCLRDAFAAGELHPSDLKSAVHAYVMQILEPIKLKLGSTQLQALRLLAYPEIGSVSKIGSKTKAAAETKNSGEQSVRFDQLDIRVGQIASVKRHPDADGLYVEEINLGENKNRTIVSGLVNYYSLEEMQNRKLLVLCNLKPAKLRGILSQGMVLCASTESAAVNADGLQIKTVEILSVPEDAQVGERVVLENHQFDSQQPDTQLNPKKKIWEQLQPDLKTDSDCHACWKSHRLVCQTSGQPITCPSLKNAPIK